jgi:transglutaminase-like putative cysteine protease
MELEVSHTTRYDFTQPVFLEPHLFRFQPRSDGAQTLVEFHLDIDPTPAGSATWLDGAGNVTTSVWFDGLHPALTVTAHSVTRMLRDNPFEFLVDRSRTMLPADYGDELPVLRPYLQRAPRDGADAVAQFAARMRDAARGELIPLLTCLNHTLYDRFTVVRRDEGPAWSAERTWTEQRGACRDLAVLFVDVCRALGVAARFVSGYEDAGPSAEPRDLHAWAEAYIPGGGWRGYDPSRGLATAQSHIAVAAAATSEGAAPIIGTFRGSGAARINAEIQIARACPASAIPLAV